MVFKILISLTFILGAYGQGDCNSCTTVPSNDDGNVAIIPNNTVIDNCKVVIYTCHIINPLCDVKMQINYGNSTTLTKSSETDLTSIPMPCKPLPGGVGYLYEGQRATVICLSMCPAGVTSKNGAVTFGEASSTVSTTVETSTSQPVRGCRVQKKK